MPLFGDVDRVRRRKRRRLNSAAGRVAVETSALPSRAAGDLARRRVLKKTTTDANAQIDTSALATTLKR